MTLKINKETFKNKYTFIKQNELNQSVNSAMNKVLAIPAALNT